MPYINIYIYMLQMYAPEVYLSCSADLSVYLLGLLLTTSLSQLAPFTTFLCHQTHIKLTTHTEKHDETFPHPSSSLAASNQPSTRSAVSQNLIHNLLLNQIHPPTRILLRYRRGPQAGEPCASPSEESLVHLEW